MQLVLPSLYLPLDIPEDMRTARLTSSEKHRIVERVIRRVNERIPVAYLTNRAWFCGMNFTSMNACWCRARRLVN